MTQAFDELGPLYGNIMDEVRKRASIIEAVQDQAIRDAVPIPGVSDLCVVQIRKICEGIALACLVAHSINDRGRLNRTIGHHRADLIAKGLAKIGLDAFPTPLTWADGKLTPEPDKHLSRDQLRSIYIQCDDQLHVGKLQSRKPYANVFSPQSCLEIAKQALNLIRFHHIQLGNGARLLVRVPGLPDSITTSYLVRSSDA